jgi:PPOX class probable F420-dependent enzyme
LRRGPRARDTPAVALSEAQARLLRGRNVGVVVTLRADGSPHATPVWVDWDGSRVSFPIRVGQVKERHLRRDPRVALVVVNAADPYEYVSISGRVVLTETGAEALVAKLARKYLGRADYPADAPDAVRVVAAIEPERVSGRARPS